MVNQGNGRRPRVEDDSAMGAAVMRTLPNLRRRKPEAGSIIAKVDPPYPGGDIGQALLAGLDTFLIPVVILFGNGPGHLEVTGGIGAAFLIEIGIADISVHPAFQGCHVAEPIDQPLQLSVRDMCPGL